MWSSAECAKLGHFLLVELQGSFWVSLVQVWGSSRASLLAARVNAQLLTRLQIPPSEDRETQGLSLLCWWLPV